MIVPSVDQGKRSSLRLDELGDVDGKLPDVEKYTAMAHEDLRVQIERLVSFASGRWDKDQLGGHLEFFP